MTDTFLHLNLPVNVFVNGGWYGQREYTGATPLALLLLCDCEGSNNARYYLFKEDLQVKGS